MCVSVSGCERVLGGELWLVEGLSECCVGGGCDIGWIEYVCEDEWINYNFLYCIGQNGCLGVQGERVGFCTRQTIVNSLASTHTYTNITYNS